MFVESAWLGLVPWWLTAAVVARDVMIGLGALIYRLWFGPLRGRPTVLSKINTAAQLLYVMLVLLRARLRPAAAGDARCVRDPRTRHHGDLRSALHPDVHAPRLWTLPARTA